VFTKLLCVLHARFTPTPEDGATIILLKGNSGAVSGCCFPESLAQSKPDGITKATPHLMRAKRRRVSEAGTAYGCPTLFLLSMSSERLQLVIREYRQFTYS